MAYVTDACVLSLALVFAWYSRKAILSYWAWLRAGRRQRRESVNGTRSWSGSGALQHVEQAGCVSGVDQDKEVSIWDTFIRVSCSIEKHYCFQYILYVTFRTISQMAESIVCLLLPTMSGCASSM